MRIARTVARALGLDDYLVAASHDFVDKPGRTQLIALPKATRDSARTAGRGRRRCRTNASRFPQGNRRGRQRVERRHPCEMRCSALDAFKVAGYDAYQKARVALALLTAQLYRFAASKQPGRDAADADRATRGSQRCARSKAAAATPCVTHRRSTPEWHSRAISAISRRTSAIRRISHAKRKNSRSAPQTACASKVIDEHELEEIGMGAFMSVTRAARHPAS